MDRTSSFAIAAALLVMLPATAFAQQDAGSGGPAFKEGDIITFDNIEQIRNYLPDEFWANRDFFFYEGMQMKIGPVQRDYGDPEVMTSATARFKGQSKIGPDGSLEGYTAGVPFDPDDIDCEGDPLAGWKIIWNFDYNWHGDGYNAHFWYSYWDRGEELPLYYEGTSKRVILSHRPEPKYLDEQGGDIFRGEKRKHASGIEVTGPFDARGINLMSYRYKSADAPLADAKNDDTWVYLPTLRRVRRISTAQRTDAVAGTDFTMDDLFSFAGIPPQYEWECLGEVSLLGPMNTIAKAYPYSKDNNFGPYGLSYANDNWELRKAVKIRFTPKNSDHPYHHKDLYLDKQTLTSMYAFAYDRKQELWKIIWHNKRFSEDTELTGEWYPGWDSVPEPRDLRIVSDMIINVQTGTGNRIEFWDNHGVPLKSKGKIRRYIDVGRLTKGR